MKIELGGIILPLLLIISVIASGCVDDLSTIFGPPEINVKEEVTEEISDILRIEEITAIPNEVFPDGEVTLFIKLKNYDKRKSIRYDLTLYDPSIFSVQNDHDTVNGTIYPGGEDVVQFTLKAPSKDALGNVETTATVSFRVIYSSNTTTLYDIPVVNISEIKRSQLTGRKVEISISKSIGSGPIKIDMDTVGSTEDANYIIAGQSGFIEVRIKNKGSGDLVGGVIKPKKFQLEEVGKEKRLNITPGDKELFNYTGEKIVNKKEIPLIEGESSKLLFKVNLKKGEEVGIHKTFRIKAFVNYNYELRGSQTIVVKPLLE